MSGIFKFVGIGVISFIACIVIIGMSIYTTAIFAKGDNTKDKIINVYNTFMQNCSSVGISKDKKLVGTRNFGIDKYVGTYQANYKNATGEESVFGGTTLHRKNGDHIKLKIKLEKNSGNIEVISKLGNNEISLINDSGEYEDTIYIDGVSYYLIIKLDNFNGNINIVAE